MLSNLLDSVASVCAMTSMVACGPMDPCGSISEVVAQVGIADKGKQSAITQSACNTEQPIELRQVMVSTLYLKSDKPGNASQAVKWANYAVAFKKSYITYLALFQAEQNSHLDDLAGYENSDEYKVLRDQAIRYGVKSAIQHKIVSIQNSQEIAPTSNPGPNYNRDYDIRTQMAWSVIGNLDFSGGESALSGLDEPIKDAITYLKIDEDGFEKTHFQQWYDYELSPKYLVEVAPAMDIAPSLVAVPIDLSGFKQVYEKSKTAIVAEKERKEAEARDLNENPYSVEVSCMVRGEPYNAPFSACVEELEISSAGSLRSYSGSDMALMVARNPGMTSFVTTVPEHFEISAQQRRSYAQVYLVVKNRRSQEVVFQGNTGGKYDVVRVRN